MEETHEEEHDTESIFEVVKKIGLQNKRDILEIDAANAILQANWIENVDDFEEFTAEEGNTILRIPVKLYHLIKQYIVEKGKLASMGKNDEEANRKKAQEIFDKIDADKNGSLDVSEFHQMLIGLGEYD